MDVRVFIFDEFIVVLMCKEFGQFFEVMDDFKIKGVVMVFIFYYFDEIFCVGDDVLVLCDGIFVGEVLVCILECELVMMMVGCDIDDQFLCYCGEVGEVLLLVMGFSCERVF